MTTPLHDPGPPRADGSLERTQAAASAGRRFAEILRDRRAASAAGDACAAASPRRVAPMQLPRRLELPDGGDGVERRGAGERPASAEVAQRVASGAAPDDSPPALRSVLRSLPVAIDLARVRPGEAVTLAFGSALAVELRATAAGVEVLLRPEARLFRACAVELSGLVSALRQRGVRVARAEIRSSRLADGRAERREPDGAPRVDAAPALR